VTRFAYWSESSRKITLIPLWYKDLSLRLWYKDLSLPCRCLQEVPLSLLAVRTSFAGCKHDCVCVAPIKARVLLLNQGSDRGWCYGVSLSRTTVMAVAFLS
jgi:hypothetical protein